jgi:FlaA1/EpsC-like NDP-sugar epimerase
VSLHYLDKIKRALPSIVIDLLMVLAAWFGAYWLRFNLGTIPDHFLQYSLSVLPVVVVIQGLALFWFGVFRGVWRFTSLDDLVRIIKAVVVGAAVLMALMFVTVRLGSVPRSVPFLYGMLLVAFLAGPRLLYRLLTERQFAIGVGKKVLVVGAGQAGEMLIRDLLRKAEGNYQPVAIVDDMPRRHGRHVHGVPVVGGCSEIVAFTESLEIDLILLAIPSASSEDMRRIVGLCEDSGVPFRTVPDLDALMSGQVSINELREVSIEDILGRDQVTLDWEAINSGLQGKSILVTGGGGSIGSELCRQIARLGPAKLTLLESSEFNLYSIEMELQQDFKELSLVSLLGDVSDAVTVERVFQLHKPDIVFHAAAYKHVPMLEHQVREAFNNNVLGTRNVAVNADKSGCAEFVLISTDKAVNPSNVMGASKRMAEIFCQNLNARSNTNFITVRFGNVLGSAGSVIPLFRKQIAEGGPVTVTHREMERYFMTIPEASQLIMQASVIGKGGEIFVLDMGEPVKICFLAEQMIRLSGKEPGEDIEISYTGLRPGEKLYEELFHDSEQLESTGYEKILLAQHRIVEWEKLEALMVATESACGDYDENLLLQSVEEFVPENRIESLNKKEECQLSTAQE